MSTQDTSTGIGARNDSEIKETEKIRRGEKVIAEANRRGDFKTLPRGYNSLITL